MMYDISEIAGIMASINNADDMTAFLNEILTDNEKRDLGLRWKLMEQLYEGKTQRAISSDLGISLCRITRGARILRSGDSMVEKILRERAGR